MPTIEAETQTWNIINKNDDRYAHHKPSMVNRFTCIHIAFN